MNTVYCMYGWQREINLFILALMLDKGHHHRTTNKWDFLSEREQVTLLREHIVPAGKKYRGRSFRQSRETFVARLSRGSIISYISLQNVFSHKILQ